MASKCLEFDLGHCVSSEWRDGVLRVAPDGVGDDGANEPMRPLQPLGLYARPRDPEKDSDDEVSDSAPALYGFIGDDGFIMPVTDPATIGQVPQGPPGSAVLYAPQLDLTSYVYLDGETGYIQMLVKYGDKSLSLTFDTKSDDKTITLRHGDGQGIVMTDEKLLLESGGTCWMEMQREKTIFHGPVQFNGGVIAGGSSGNPVATTVDLDTIKQAVITTIAGLVSTAPGTAVSSTVPLVAVTPGSSKLSAAT